jgi:hypothetical protein
MLQTKACDCYIRTFGGGLAYFVASSAQVEIDTDLPFSVWTAAGSAFAGYPRRRQAHVGEPQRRIVADFVIGAAARRRGNGDRALARPRTEARRHSCRRAPFFIW